MCHHAGENFYRIQLLALGGEARLSGAAAIQIALDVLVGQRQQRRAAIDHAADRDPMAFAEGRDPEHVAEGVEGHFCKLAIAAPRNVVTRAVQGVKSPLRHARHSGPASPDRAHAIVPGIHVFLPRTKAKAWMGGTTPAMATDVETAVTKPPKA